MQLNIFHNISSVFDIIVYSISFRVILITNIFNNRFITLIAVGLFCTLRKLLLSSNTTSSWQRISLIVSSCLKENRRLKHLQTRAYKFCFVYFIVSNTRI